jgi:hypothetical protein
VKKETNESRRSKVTEEHLQEAATLRDLWAASQEERSARGVGSQLAFGAKYNIGSQAAVGGFLNGLSPLSLKAAVGFAKGLNCKVGEFSPRLAKVLEADAVVYGAGGEKTVMEFTAPEPETRVSPEALNLAMRLDALTDPGERDKAYALLERTLQVFEAAQRQAGRQPVVAPPAPIATRRAAPRKPARSR